MKSLKSKISLGIIAICLIQAVIMGGYSIRSVSQASTEISNQELEALAKQSALAIRNGLDTQFKYLEALAISEQVCSPNADELARKQYLMGLSESLDNVNDMGFADASGNTLVSDLKTVANISEREYFKEAMNGKNSVSDPIEDSAKPGVIVMQFAVPVYNGDQVIGVLYMLCDGNFVSNISNQLTFGKGGQAYVINGEGTNVANVEQDKVINQENAIVQFADKPDFASLITCLKYVLSKPSGYSYYEYQGIGKSIGFSEIEGTDWKVVTYIPTNEILASMKTARAGILTITVIIVIFFAVLAYLFVSKLIKPVTTVGKKLDKIAEGDYTEDIPERLCKLKDETGALARSLQHMQESTRELITAISHEADSVENASNSQEKKISTLMGDVEDVTATTEELSASSEETAAASEQMNTAAVDAQQAIAIIAESAQSGTKTASQISERAKELEESSKKSQESAVTMHESAMKTLKDAIEDSHKVSAITELTNSILDITSQTNLLALNASIEAARAGEAGKGFAVVATEIGKLADDSQKSANQIKDVTEKVLESVANLSNCATQTLDYLDQTVMADYQKMVDTGVQYKKDAEQIFSMMQEFNEQSDQLLQSMENISGLIDGINTTTQEVADGATNIAQSCTDISGNTSDILLSAQETVGFATKLREVVTKFQIK